MTLIGATTENPYFEVNSALLSRSQIYELHGLEAEQVRELLERALADPERGIAEPPAIDDEALELLAERAGGDARTALGGARAGGRDRARRRRARSTSARPRTRCSARRSPSTSRATATTTTPPPDQGDARLRPRRAVYYLAAMLEGGEDPRFIARRMVIFASEDIGNADPQALVRRHRAPPPRSTGSACPSARSTSPRPPSTWRWRRSRTPRRSRSRGRWPTIREHGAKLPPDYLRDAHYPGAKKLGRGRATATRTTSRAASPTSRCCRPRCRASASTSRPTAGSRPSSRSAWTPPGGVEPNEKGQRPPPVVGERLGPLATEGR